METRNQELSRLDLSPFQKSLLRALFFISGCFSDAGGKFVLYARKPFFRGQAYTFDTKVKSVDLTPFFSPIVKSVGLTPFCLTTPINPIYIIPDNAAFIKQEIGYVH